MKKKFIAIIFVLSLPILSGCFGSDKKATVSDAPGVASFLVSSDGGKTFVPKVAISEKKTIGNVNILSMTLDPGNSQTIYIGTVKNGIFVTHNAGEQWEKLHFPPQKVYGIAVSAQNSQVIYATGVLGNVTKIYKSIDGGQKWDEVYTEPIKDSILVSLAIDPRNGDVLYAGTSNGVIIKTDDGGVSWRNIHTARAPITTIAFDAQDSQTVYFAQFQRGLLKTRDGGNTVEDFSKKLRERKVDKKTEHISNGRVFSLTVDPKTGGTVYVGTDEGVYRSTDYANNWESLNVIGSTKKLPVRLIAIDPHDTSRMIYAVARTLYRSADNMTEWTPMQISATRLPSILRFNPDVKDVIFVGLRKDK